MDVGAQIAMYSVTASLAVVFVVRNLRVRRRKLQCAYAALLLVCCILRILRCTMRLFPDVDARFGHAVNFTAGSLIICCKMVSLSIWHQCVVAFKGLKISANLSKLLQERRGFNQRIAVFCCFVLAQGLAFVVARGVHPDNPVVLEVYTLWLAILTFGVGVVTTAVGVRLRMRLMVYAANIRSDEGIAAIKRLKYFTVGAGIVSISFIARGLLAILDVVSPEFWEAFEVAFSPFATASYLLVVEVGPSTFFLLLLYYMAKKRRRAMSQGIQLTNLSASLLQTSEESPRESVVEM